jgi:hypothetical protein
MKAALRVEAEKDQVFWQENQILISDFISEYQNIRISEYQNIRISEYQNIRISEYQNIRISEYQNQILSIKSNGRLL